LILRRAGSFISNIAIISFSAMLYGMPSTARRLPPTTLRLPSPAASQEAHEALRVLSAVTKRKGARPIVVKTESGSELLSVTVPKEAFDLFLEVLGQMANGNAVTIVPTHAEVTTQEAAEFLNVSRPFVVKLIEEGKLPCRRVGTHRRIKMADLLQYKDADAAARTAVLNELAEEAQKHGLGY
jgi:excisionase family DNA binding protein